MKTELVQGPEGVWTMSGPPAVLVNASSATHSRPGEDQAHDIHAVNRSHSEMLMFSRRDVDYNIVLGFLQEFAISAPKIIEARFIEERRGGIALNLFHFVYASLTWRPQTMPVSSPDVEMHGLGKSTSCS